MSVPTARRAALETGVLYCEDNLSRLSRLPDDSVDLIYLDPPFFSNRHYEVIWGDEAEVRSFEDRWEGGMHHYIGWMRDRLLELHRVLKPTGSLYLHCDYHASHYLKVMLDSIFGAKHLCNEIVWCYRGGGVPKRAFARKHDTIFFYAKGSNWTFNPQYVPYSEASQALVASRGGVSIDNRVRDVRRGAHMPDWWADMNSLQTWSPERVGYPTQKPEALLRRIITASSKPGDVVLDPFCGCGTTVNVAEQLERRWIGIDISPTAVNLMRRRLLKSTNGLCKPHVEGLPTTAEELRTLKPFEFQNWIIGKVWGTSAPRKSGDMGIDGYSFMVHDPIQVKQSDKVGRNVVDNFETAMRRAGRTNGFIIAFSFTRDAREEVARARVQESLDITLVTVQDLLDAKDETGPLTPKSATITDMPLTAPTQPKDLPSAAELIASESA
jgi:DNA modification methylase